jgi:osmoprotectant transport system permease protein
VIGQVPTEPLIRWNWLGDHLGELRERTLQHLQLTVVSMVFGLIIAAGLASVIRRFRWTSGPITAITTLLYAIPAVALFAALIPWLGTGTSVPTVALTTYSLVVLTPFLVEAFDGVPVAARDAADGMGLTTRQRFWRVEVPLALPTVISGVRIATVTTIGLVTVGGLFDLGGFGNLIDDGQTRDFPTLIVVGVVGSVLLAIVFDLLLVLAGRLLSPWRRKNLRSAA